MAEVILHPAALREWQAAVEWYQQRSARAADRFASQIQRTLEAIGEQPDRFGWYDHEFREAPARRYPYSIIDRVLPSGHVQVVAIAHASREPDYWRRRASP
jgi:toxin ParE1/3/4